MMNKNSISFSAFYENAAGNRTIKSWTVPVAEAFTRAQRIAARGNARRIAFALLEGGGGGWWWEMTL